MVRITLFRFKIEFCYVYGTSVNCMFHTFYIFLVALGLGVRQPGSGANHSPPSGAKVKNARSCPQGQLTPVAEYLKSKLSLI
jgi:hypothetical protein